MMAVAIETRPRLQASKTRALFEGRYEASFLSPGIQFSTSTPSRRFLLIIAEEAKAPRQLHLITNWFEELKRLAPSR